MKLQSIFCLLIVLALATKSVSFLPYQYRSTRHGKREIKVALLFISLIIIISDTNYSRQFNDYLECVFAAVQAQTMLLHFK